MAGNIGDVKMLILFVGDSYSANHEGWPSMIVDHYNADYINESMPGGSLNYMFSKLEFQLRKQLPDIVILTITSSDRIFHPDMIIYGGGIRRNDGIEVDENIKKLIEQYYLYISNNENMIIYFLVIFIKF